MIVTSSGSLFSSNISSSKLISIFSSKSIKSRSSTSLLLSSSIHYFDCVGNICHFWIVVQNVTTLNWLKMTLPFLIGYNFRKFFKYFLFWNFLLRQGWNKRNVRGMSSLGIQSNSIISLVFLSKATQICLCLLYFIPDSTDLFFKNWFLNRDLFMISLLSSLVTKLEWLALRYFFFKGAYLFNVSTMVRF